MTSDRVHLDDSVSRNRQQEVHPAVIACSQLQHLSIRCRVNRILTTWIGSTSCNVDEPTACLRPAVFGRHQLLESYDRTTRFVDVRQWSTSRCLALSKCPVAVKTWPV